jgi:hypothetical protein
MSRTVTTLVLRQGAIRIVWHSRRGLGLRLLASKGARVYRKDEGRTDARRYGTSDPAGVVAPPFSARRGAVVASRGGQGCSAASGSGAVSGGTGDFEIEIETPREELEPSTRRFRDALSAAIAARPERYTADQQERDTEIRADEDRQARSLEADQAIVDRVMEE